MDENNTDNPDEKSGPPPKENIFKSPRFYAAYLAAILVLCVASWIIPGDGGTNNWLFGVLLLCIPYIIIGLIAWAVLRKKNRAIALGILLGSITPFIAVFIGTGGCGLYMF